MQIIEVTPFFWPSEGGTQRAAFNISREFSKLGHNVLVLTYNATGNTNKGLICTSLLKSHENVSGITINRFKYTTISGLKFSPALSIGLLASLLKRKGEIVHYHGFFHLPNVVLISFLCKIARTPLFLTTHGLHEATSDYSRYPNSFMKIFASITIKIVIRNVNSFIALTPSDVATLKGLGLSQSKIVCISNGVDIKKFQAKKFDENLLNRYGISSSGPLILCVCRISRNKGLKYLIEASSEVSSKIKDLKVLIIGPTQESSYKAELTDLVNKLDLASIINFRENVPDSDLVNFYKIADLFVLPSEQETLPLVLFEAMAAGCPLIATSVGGIPEVINDNVNGLLVNPKDVFELASKICLLLQNDDLKKKMSIEEKKTVLNYSWQKIASHVLNLYQLSMKSKRFQSNLEKV